MNRWGDSDSALTLAGQAESLLETVEASHGFLGGALTEKVPGEETGKVLDRSVDLVTTDGRGGEPEPGLDIDGQADGGGHVEGGGEREREREKE